MVLFSMVAIIYSIIGITSITATTRDIVKHDLVVINSAIKLRESLLNLQGYAGKYAILRSPEFINLFREREIQFLSAIAQLRNIEDTKEISDLEQAFESYRSTAIALFQKKFDSSNQLKISADKVLFRIDSIYTNRQNTLTKKLIAAERQETSTVRLTLFLSISGFCIGTSIAAFIIFSIYRTIGNLKQATQRIAEGDFDHVPPVPSGDEFGDLAEDFTKMAKRLKELEQISLDASPLTRLPGNIAIERVLTKRLNDDLPFAVCYADLDNLKAYNDRYGYIKASEVIRITGEIISEVVSCMANEDAFVGHVGGDDFVMIVSENESASICETVIARFDRMIKEHYSEEDQAKGAYEGIDRYGVLRVFTLMTISIAVVICRQGQYDSAVDIAKATAEIKDFVKGLPGSNYFINRRKGKR